MTRYTTTKKDRIFERVEVKDKKGRYIRTDTVRKDPPDPARTPDIRICPECRKPITASKGQIVHIHKGCRKMYRRRR